MGRPVSSHPKYLRTLAPGDREDPVLETFGVPLLGELLRDSEKNFLKGILSFVDIFKSAPAKTFDWPLETIEQGAPQLLVVWVLLETPTDIWNR